ncbi:hypothetical protein [Rhodovulum adriaticum]|uniref:hypothetical protein n=1 Tax=Rhodovulum adriaticum TaxID=35804 RepID=UPI0010504383|nr:hypothetical protein [Rhodovulum adriaticum]
MLFVQDHPDGSCHEIASLASSGYRVDTAFNLSASYEALIRHPGAHDILLVRSKGLGPLDETLKYLSALRKALPEIVVILLCDELLLDKCGLEELEIADVQLRDPTPPTILCCAVSIAKVNNKFWRERQTAYARSAV